MLVLKTPESGPYDALLAWLVGAPCVVIVAAGLVFLIWVLVTQVRYYRRAPGR